uniref:Uncharacterized protein n=1 Tax=Rhizoctonia solani TaxID=456999 RepID=N0A5E0_9AGAM|nr:hypothetical protein RSOL_m01600 [Rhizoctonia solani]AGK45468.1 hypothetical protein RSOL_m01600 [Rhizoctonia solani]
MKKKLISLKGRPPLIELCSIGRSGVENCRLAILFISEEINKYGQGPIARRLKVTPSLAWSYFLRPYALRRRACGLTPAGNFIFSNSLFRFYNPAGASPEHALGVENRNHRWFRFSAGGFFQNEPPA